MCLVPIVANVSSLMMQQKLSVNRNPFLYVNIRLCCVLLLLIYGNTLIVYVYGRSPAEIVGSNPTGGMDVCLL